YRREDPRGRRGDGGREGRVHCRHARKVFASRPRTHERRADVGAPLVDLDSWIIRSGRCRSPPYRDVTRHFRNRACLKNCCHSATAWRMHHVEHCWRDYSPDGRSRRSAPAFRGFVTMRRYTLNRRRSRPRHESYWRMRFSAPDHEHGPARELRPWFPANRPCLTACPASNQWRRSSRRSSWFLVLIRENYCSSLSDYYRVYLCRP